MEAIVGADIRIRDCNRETENFFEEKLTFDNPEYFKRLNSGRWIGDTPKKISLVERHGTEVILPFGMLPLIFQSKSIFTGIYHSFNTQIGRYDYKSIIKPYDYQETAIQSAIKKRQGIIVAPCGAGKTQIGLEIAARIGGRMLWLTHTTDLLNQSMDRAKAMFGLSERDYGTITAGKIDVGNVVTFATVQTMSKLDLKKLEDLFDVVIVDECHHVVGTPSKVMMFYRVISGIKARYKFGLTATPKRSDGLTPCMFALIGPKIYEIEKESVENTTCPVKVIVKKTAYMPDIDRILMPDGTISYPRFMDDIISSKERNDLIVDDAINSKGTCLILTDRIAHLELLQKRLEERGIKAVSLSASKSKKSKEDRKNALYALNTKCIKVLIATYALAKEGLDVPSLDNLIMATPQKNETVVTQSAGRVARKFEGKEFGTIYDYQDGFNMLTSWQKKRNSMYKKLGFEIVEE